VGADGTVEFLDRRIDWQATREPHSVLTNAPIPRQQSRLEGLLEGHDRGPPCPHLGEDRLLVLLLDPQLLERFLQVR
jgi:hypothetical protein